MRACMKMGLIGLILMSVLTSACAPQPVLVRQEIVGGKSVKHVLLLTGSGDEGNLYDYIMRVCDYDEKGMEVNCKDSVVLQNVQAQSIY